MSFQDLLPVMNQQVYVYVAATTWAQPECTDNVCVGSMNGERPVNRKRDFNTGQWQV
jgi:hypothetical protein